MEAARKILVAEDDFTTRRAWCELITSWGFRVEAATDGRSALELIDSFAPDAILLDLNLPEKDGLEVLAELGGKAREIPTIVVSGRSAKADAERSIALGASEYLRKPVNPTQLRGLLDMLMRSASGTGAEQSEHQYQRR